MNSEIEALAREIEEFIRATPLPVSNPSVLIAAHLHSRGYRLLKEGELIVPREPTEVMLKAAWAKAQDFGPQHPPYLRPADVYRAMLESLSPHPKESD